MVTTDYTHCISRTRGCIWNLEVDSALVGTICTHFLKIPRTKKPACLAIPQMAKMLKLSLLMLFCIISRVRVLLCSTIMHILG